MRPGRAKAWDRAILSVAAGAVLTAGVMLSAGTARADVVDDYVARNGHTVCEVLDRYPSVAGIEGIGKAIMDDGLSPKATGAVVADSVILYCPEHLDVLQAFIDKWASVGVAVA